MFVILKPVDAPDGFFASRKKKKEIDRKPAEFIKTPAGIPFAVLEIFNGKNGIDWKTVIGKCGRYTSRVIVPDNISLPENQHISAFIPSYFPQRLCLNTAIEILKSVKLKADSFTLSLCDRDGRFSSELHRLIPFCSSVKVITEKEGKYIPVCTEILESTGASVILRPSFEKGTKRDAVIFCNGEKSVLHSADLVFSPDKSIKSKTTVIGRNISLLDEHKEAIGNSIDSVAFAGAVTELCSSHIYENSVCEDIDIIRKGGKSAFEDLISALSESGIQ